MLFLLVYRNHFFLRFSSIVRVTWSHALALDCIRDILWLQFVQKTRGVDVCVLPSKDATSGSSRKHTSNDGCCSIFVCRNHFFLRFSSPSPKLQSRVVPSSKDAEFNAAFLCIQQIKKLQGLLKELGFPQTKTKLQNPKYSTLLANYAKPLKT